MADSRTIVCVDLVLEYNRAIDTLMAPGATWGDRKIAREVARSGVSREALTKLADIRTTLGALEELPAREALFYGILAKNGPQRDPQTASDLYRAAADKGCAQAAFLLFTIEYERRVGWSRPPSAVNTATHEWLDKTALEIAALGVPDAYVYMVTSRKYITAREIALLHKGIDEGSSMCAMHMSRLGGSEAGRIFFLKMAAMLGHSSAREELLCMQPDMRIPFGYWEPTYECNQWIEGSLRAEIKTVLLMSVRETTPFALLPRDVVYALCFWLSTGPRVAEPRKRARTASLQQQLFEARKQRKESGRVDGRPHQGWYLN